MPWAGRLALLTGLLVLSRLTLLTGLPVPSRLPLLNRLAAADVAGPSWLSGTFAALMIVTAGYCASRLVAARRWRRPTEHDVDVMHAVMGAAMAGMLVPQLNLLRYGSWEIVFAAAMGWFGWQVIAAYRSRPAHVRAHGHRPDAYRAADRHRPGHHVPHLLGCGAMLYMFLAAGQATTRAGPPGMPVGGPPASAAHSPGLALPLALALLGYAIWTTDRLAALPRVAALAAWIQVPAMNARAMTAPPPAALPGPGSARPAAPVLPAPVLPGPDLPAPVLPGPVLPALVPPGPVLPRPVLPRPVLPAPAMPGPTMPGPPMSPRLAACCEIAMGVTMGYMLIQML